MFPRRTCLLLLLALTVALVGAQNGTVTIDCERKLVYDCNSAKVCTIPHLHEMPGRQFYFRNVRCPNNVVRVIRVVNSNFPTIVPTLLANFPKLENISAPACGIRELSKRDLTRNASFLLELLLPNNLIEQLAASTFVEAAALIRLDLSNNSLRGTLGRGIFSDLERLEFLDLSGNRLTGLDENVFTPLKSLMELRLSGNRLEAIDEGLFRQNARLRTLALSENHLLLIQDNSFDRLSQLVEFSLAKNQLTEFPLTKLATARSADLSSNLIPAIRVSENIQILDVSSNRLEKVACENNSVIQELNLANNSLSLTDIQCVLKLQSLLHLNLSYNLIGELKVDTLGQLVELRVLALRSIGLQIVDHGTFSHQAQLEVLDLAFNQLKSIDLGLFFSQTNLVSLFIDGNDLNMFDSENIRVVFPNLRELGISANNFACSYLTKMITSFRKDPQIQVDPPIPVRNRPNVKGIECKRDTDDFPPISPNETGKTLNFSDVSGILGRVFNNLANQKDEILNQMQQLTAKLDQLTSENELSNQLLEKMADRMGNFTSDKTAVMNEVIAQGLRDVLLRTATDDTRVAAMASAYKTEGMTKNSQSSITPLLIAIVTLAVSSFIGFFLYRRYRHHFSGQVRILPLRSESQYTLQSVGQTT